MDETKAVSRVSMGKQYVQSVGGKVEIREVFMETSESGEIRYAYGLEVFADGNDVAR